ncbi:hypothetical protein C8R43DRAFT_1142460 [Mycena crocata]|nr:hypothetical protein C8R43DRAFT_1142460 [Mycena crocata]
MANEDVNMGDLEPTAKMDFKTMTLTPIAGRAAPNDDEPARVELQTNLAQQEQNHERDLSQKNNEIAAILGRLRPSNPKTIVPGAFPPADPVLVPQFITEQTKRARYLETVYKRADKGARIPILPLQPAASSSETREIPEEVLTFDDQDEQSVAFVTDIVKRVPGEMRITEVQSKLTEGEDILYKRAFREVWRTTFQRVTAAEFSDYQPVSVDKVIACNAGEVGPDEADLTLDFSEGFMSSLWNKELLQRLTSSFLEARSRGPNKYGLPDVSAEYVMGEYYGHLKRSQETWALWQPRYNKLTGTCETANEVKIRVEAYLKKRQLSVNGRGARQRKYKRRVKVVKSLIDIKIERGDVDLESWRFLLRILEHLGVGGMSSEDNGVGEFQGRTTPIFVVRLCPWRTQTVTDYMKLVDQSGSSMATNIHALPARTVCQSQRHHAGADGNAAQNRPRYYEEELRISEEAFELLVVATSNLTS